VLKFERDRSKFHLVYDIKNNDTDAIITMTDYENIIYSENGGFFKQEEFLIKGKFDKKFNNF